jgi:hypothetical protein
MMLLAFFFPLMESTLLNSELGCVPEFSIHHFYCGLVINSAVSLQDESQTEKLIKDKNGCCQCCAEVKCIFTD